LSVFLYSSDVFSGLVDHDQWRWILKDEGRDGGREGGREGEEDGETPLSITLTMTYKLREGRGEK